MQKLVRKFYYDIIFSERNIITKRQLAGQSFSEVIDLALKVYLMNWGVPPDSMTVHRTATYLWT